MGSVKAKTNLATLLLQGKGGNEDKLRAIQLLEEAALAGHNRAMYNLGLAYKTGNGVGVNASLAFNLFLAAANQGQLAEAMIVVAKAYETGEGTTANKTKAQTWRIRAAEVRRQGQRLKSQAAQMPCESVERSKVRSEDVGVLKK
jgi:TPR repeat protein